MSDYTCTIDYGTDPSYTNLDYRDTSSTQDQIASIILSQVINGDTTYYYIVSAVTTRSQCVRVQGRFQAGRYMSLDVHMSIKKWGKCVACFPPVCYCHSGNLSHVLCLYYIS